MKAHPIEHRHAAPEKWPPLWRWLSIARENALDLFPRECYEALRTEKRLLAGMMSVINDPATVKWICGRGADGFRLSNLHLRVLTPSLGNGLIVAQGSDWRVQRRISTRLLSRKKVENVASVSGVERRISELLDHFDRQISQQVGAIDVLPELIKTVVDILIIYSLDTDKIRVDDGLIRKINLHRSIVENFDRFDALGVPSKFWSRKMRRAQNAASSFDDQIEGELSELINDWTLSIDSQGNISKRDFIVSILTGFESVAVTCAWALGLLSQCMDLQNRLRVIEDSNTSPITGGNEIDRFVLEVLRMYPPLPLIYRQSIANHNTPVGIIRKDELICISPWIMHRHQKLWTAPDKFDPTRWETTKVASSDHYLPFGVGARQCVGMHMGLFLVSLIVQRVLQRYQVRPAHKALPGPRAGVSLRPLQPLHIELSPL